MDARLPAHLEVAGLIRAVDAAGGFATVVAKGERDAGTLLIICCKNGTNGRLYERMPQLDGTRAWTLTKGAGTRLFAFFALLFVAYIVISMVAGIVLQALGLLTPEALTGGGVLAFALVASVIAALLAMLMSGILVSIHRQLAGKGPAADDEYDA